MLIGAYCAANWAIYITSDRLAFSIFLFIYAVSFLAIGWISRPEATTRRRLVLVEEPEPASAAGASLTSLPTPAHAG